jgi:hypothetical protein
MFIDKVLFKLWLAKKLFKNEYANKNYISGTWVDEIKHATFSLGL